MSQNPDTSQNPQARTKVVPSTSAALEGLADGSVVLIGGFEGLGVPEALLKALFDRGASGLTCICQGPVSGGPGRQTAGLNRLAASGRIAKLIAPVPYFSSEAATADGWDPGSLEIEAVPQGVLAERLRAGGSGLGGIFLPTGAGLRFQDGPEGSEVRPFDGRDHIFYPALRADFALLRAAAADPLGNLVYQGAHRNWNPVMAMAAATVAEVDEIVELGGLDPELVISPGIFVNRVVQSI